MKHYQFGHCAAQPSDGKLHSDESGYYVLAFILYGILSEGPHLLLSSFNLLLMKCLATRLLKFAFLRFL